MNKKIEKKSLSEKVAKSLSYNLSESENESESEVGPKVIDFEKEDYGDEDYESFSHIRKQNALLLSEQSSKYSGEIVSRKTFDTSKDFSNDDSENGEEDQDSTEDESQQQDDFNSSSDAGKNSRDDCEESIETNLVMADSNKIEVQKGLCVQNQLALWEKLLEIRIHSQKILNKANSLPCPDDFAKLSTENEYNKSTKEARISAMMLLEKLIETQINLASQFSDIKKLGICSRKRTHSRTNENTDHPSKRIGLVIESNFEKFRPYRNSVFLKWDDRTKLLAPSGAMKRNTIVEDFDIVRKVDNLLIRRDNLIAKSQKLKGNYTLFGAKQNALNEKIGVNTDVFSPHIYDDTDFYHSQLRELIEFKSNVSADTYDVTKQYAELQKLRQKMKKKVDTRASKGRKIRYVVHHKLINFMAPNNPTEWTEASKNELYSSLFVQ